MLHFFNNVADGADTSQYTDNCNGSIRALHRTGATATNRALGVTVAAPSSFAEGNNGELYVLTLSNGVYRVDAP